MSRRVKVVHVSNELLVALLRLDGTTRAKVEGLPADAEIVDVSGHQYFDRNVTSFKVHSAEFPAVPPGQAIPELRLECSEVRDGPGVPFQLFGGDDPAPTLTVHDPRPRSV